MKLTKVCAKSRCAVVIGALAVATLTLSSSVAVAAPEPSSVSTAPSVDPKITAKAKEWFHRFQSRNIDRSQLDARVNVELTEAMLSQEEATLKPFGNPTAFVFMRSGVIEDAAAFEFLLTFKAGKIIESIAFDKDGKIAGIDFQTFAR